MKQRESGCCRSLAIKKWRKCMGIEPTRQLVTGTLVLKKEPYVKLLLMVLWLSFGSEVPAI